MIEVIEEFPLDANFTHDVVWRCHYPRCSGERHGATMILLLPVPFINEILSEKASLEDVLLVAQSFTFTSIRKVDYPTGT